MKFSIFHLAIIGSLVIVFATTIHLSLKGWMAAKYFLWLWALLLIFAATSFAFQEKYTVRTDVAGLALLFFIYTLFIFNRRSKNHLDIAQDEIRRLLAESNNRMDDERRRISRRLHDDINPKLIIAKMELQQLQFLLDNSNDDATEAARSIIKKLLASISDIYNDSREIIKNTRIEIIDSIGLTAAIESCITHYNSVLEKPRITLKHNLVARPVLPSAVAVNAYRIVQEALLNAVKHAEASTITVSIRQIDNRFETTIADDGTGINSKNTHGIGLIDMRERANVLGSELRITESEGKGTVVSFSFSVPESSNQI